MRAIINSLLRDDNKFRWLLSVILVVALFEFFSLAGFHLPPLTGAIVFGTIITIFGYRTLVEGFKALFHLNFRSIRLLMLIAAGGAFYLQKYEEAAVVILLFTLSERLETYGIETSKAALEELLNLTPKTAIMRDAKNDFIEVPISTITVGARLIVKPSMMIAMDGDIIDGSSTVDESTITGEPLPIDKHPGDKVFAGTLNHRGFLEICVTRKAKDSTLATIAELTLSAARSRSSAQQFIERFSAYYTPSIVLMAVLLVTIPTLIYGSEQFNAAFNASLVLLVIACPCALVISTPISIFSAIGNASRNGVVIKGGKFIEALARVRVVAMDKTRTLTRGKPIVTDILPLGENTREHLLACAAGIERYSEHPLAQSIIDAARQANITPHRATNFEAVLGKGAKADCMVCFDEHHCVGKLKFIQEEHYVKAEIETIVHNLQLCGKTSILVTTNREVEGVIAVADEIKPDAEEAINMLHQLGIKTVMLTGDNHASAQAVGQSLRIGAVQADLLPEEKAEAISLLRKKYGAVAMIGDGVNDAPALATADVGISLAADEGASVSDTATEASSITILSNRLQSIPYLIRLGRRTVLIIRANTMLAIATKLAFIALAVLGAGNIAMAIFADVGIAVIVILNSLRLLKNAEARPEARAHS